MTRVHRKDGSTKDPRPTYAHSGILLNLKVVRLLFGIRLIRGNRLCWESMKLILNRMLEK
jgi:hypothetical protein